MGAASACSRDSFTNPPAPPAVQRAPGPDKTIQGTTHYMTTATTAPATKQVAINDIGSAEDFLAAVEKTLKFFNDGDLIEGTVVKIDRDEVLLDVGYKTEGVIPSRELSIKHDVDPNEVVKVGDHVEALVLQKEDKEGRLILSKKRAQYERAWGTIEKLKEADEVVTGPVSRGKRDDLEKLSGQRMYPVIEFEDSTIYRAQSKDMAARIAAGKLFEGNGAQPEAS